MAFWDRLRLKKEPEGGRSSIENPEVPISARAILEHLGIDDGVTVNEQSALTVPGIWAAVNFISGTIAGLPLHAYTKDGEGRRTRVDAAWESVLSKAVTEYMSSFDWRKYTFERILTYGRSYTLIERQTIRTLPDYMEIKRLIPLDPENMRVRQTSGGFEYHYTANGKTHVYLPMQIIDVAFTKKRNMIDHYSPIQAHRDVIALGIAATQWGSRFFANGGVPPFVLTGPFQSGGALDRASDDLARAVKTAAKEGRQALTLPAGHELKTIGTDAEKAQLTDTKRFLIEEYARIYSLPPVFLQDLSRSTFSNSEQQDLHFVKHTIKRWVEQFEQELNLKLFQNSGTYAEFNLDGLLRGDFKTRMDGYAQGIQHALLTPNEIRRMENMPDAEGGDQLYIQGATVPLGQQPEATNAEGD